MLEEEGQTGGGRALADSVTSQLALRTRRESLRLWAASELVWSAYPGPEVRWPCGRSRLSTRRGSVRESGEWVGRESILWPFWAQEGSDSHWLVLQEIDFFFFKGKAPYLC